MVIMELCCVCGILRMAPPSSLDPTIPAFVCGLLTVTMSVSSHQQCVASIRCSIAFCMKRRLYVYSLPIQQESSHKWRRNAEITERNQSPRGSKQPFLCFPIATHHPTFYSPVPKLSRCNSQTMSSEAKPSVQAFGRKVRCDELCILIPNAL